MKAVASAAPSAVSEQDAAGSPADPALRLARLIEHIQSRPQRVAQAAERLVIEVDGIPIAVAELSRDTARVALPADAVSVSLRDEQGNLRAHVLLQEQQVENALFDQGRVLLSIEHDGLLIRSA